MTDRLKLSPSLRTQLALAFGSLAALLAAALSVALGSMLARETAASEGAALRAVSRNVATALADDLRKNMRSVEVLSKSPAIWKDGLASPAVDAMMARIQAVNPDYSCDVALEDMLCPGAAVLAPPRYRFPGART